MKVKQNEHGTFYEQPLSYLHISTRLSNCLRRLGITLIGQLLELDPKRILTVGGGSKTLQELLKVSRKVRGDKEPQLSLFPLHREKANEDIECSPLSVRAKRVLHELGASTTSEATCLTEDDILEHKSAGAKTLSEIKQYLADRSLALQQQSLAVSPHIDIEDKETLLKLLQPIAILDLTKRAEKAALKMHPKTIGDLVILQPADFRRQTKVGRGTVNEIEKKLAALGFHLGTPIPNWDYYQQTSRRTLAAEIKRFGENLAKAGLDVGGCNVNQVLLQLLSKVKKTRQQEILSMYYGFAGGRRLPLQTVADQVGLTRQRIQQMTAKFEQSCKHGLIYKTPVINCVAALEELSCITVEEADKRLIERGFAQAPLGVWAVVSMAELLGIPVNLKIEKIGNAEMVLRTEMVGLGKSILSTARKVIGFQGVSNLEHVSFKISEALNKPVKEEFVRTTLAQYPSVQWLDSEKDWFWISDLPPRRNRLLNNIVKILAVSKKIEVSELREGVRRPVRCRGFAPPKRILLELCKQLEWCRVNGSVIEQAQPLEIRRIINRSERELHDLITRNGNAMTRPAILEKGVSLGLNENTINMQIFSSPILKRLKEGVYGVRGIATSLSLLQSIEIPKRQRGLVTKDHGWTSNGTAWICYVISQGMLNNGVFSIPAPFQTILAGDYSFFDHGEKTESQVTVKNTQGWNIKPFFRGKGAETGDYLALLFDPRSRTASAFLGDDDLLDSLSSGTFGANVKVMAEVAGTDE